MFTDQDRIYIQQIKAVSDKSIMIDRVCALFFFLTAFCFGWLVFSENVHDGHRTIVSSAFVLTFILRYMFGVVGSRDYQDLVVFLEAKLAEVDEKGEN